MVKNHFLMKQKMKRYNNLFDKIISIENLRLADEKARKGKTNSYGVKVHDKNRENNILKLHQALKNGTFRTSEYTIFKIYEPKERDIYRLPYYPDRIVHHAIMNVMEPIWTSIFTNDTCACIKKRGLKGAFERMKKYLKDIEGTQYCLKIDIKKFYPSIDHGKMKWIIRKKIKDERLLQLLDGIIDSADGVPIGNYLSQYFANLFLAYFDHYVKEVLKVKYYVRYADDMVFLTSSKEELIEILKRTKDYMGSLQLQLKGNEQIFRVAYNNTEKDARGIDFVGYVFYHNQTLLRKSIKKRLIRKCCYMNKLEFISHKSYKMGVGSWWGWIKYSNSRNLARKYIKREVLEQMRWY